MKSKLIALVLLVALVALVVASGASAAIGSLFFDDVGGCPGQWLRDPFTGIYYWVCR